MSLAEFVSGGAFGSALLVSGVYIPEVIKAQMVFSNNHMLMVFLGASATSAIVLDLADRAKHLSRTPRPESSLGLFPFDGNVIGGLMVGVGMAATGACPGTALVQVSKGMFSGGMAALGGLIGAQAYVYLKTTLKAKPKTTNESSNISASSSSTSTAASSTSSKKPLDIHSALSVDPMTMVLVWVPMCIGVVLAANYIDRSRTSARPPSDGAVYGGPLIGLSQAITVLLTGRHVGITTAYENIATWIQSLFRKDENTKPPSLFTPSVVFSIGVLVVPAILGRYISGVGSANLTSLDSNANILAQIIGGAIMVFGGRVAGGCTSGHGISGLSAFSISSLAATASIFGGGMLTAQVLGY